MLEDKSTDQENVAVTPYGSGYRFTVLFRGTTNPYGKVFPTEMEAMEAGQKMLANIKASYLHVLMSTRR